MGKAYYVKFETPEDLVSPILEAVRVASTSGKVKKGTNEATKAIERGTSKLIVIAEDVEPPEVVAHLPILCEEQGAAYAFVPNKEELGKSLGIDITQPLQQFWTLAMHNISSTKLQLKLLNLKAVNLNNECN